MNAPTKMTAKQLTGYDRLHNARLNKGTAFTEAERSAFGLEGLLPPAVPSLELQVAPPGPIACATPNGTSGLVGHHPGWAGDRHGEAPSDAALAHFDLWVQAPGDVPVGYSNKSGGVFNLLRDDLGKAKDMTDGNSFVN